MELFVRAGRRDNLVIEELVAPASVPLFGIRQVPFRGLVVDAHVAAAQPDLRAAAEAAGLPLMVDPLTSLLQDFQAADDPWAGLPFAQPEKLEPDDLKPGALLDELIDRTVRFQIEQGASVVIPPYFHAAEPSDPWFAIQLACNRRAAVYLEAEGITLPVAPIFAVSLRRFGTNSSQPAGVDAFVRSIRGMNVRHVGIALSASRSQSGDTEDRLSAYLSTVAHVAAQHPVMAWRQGQYGLAALAAGATGYQAGPGVDERCDLPQLARRRRPTDQQAGFGAPRQVFIPLFGRSVPGPAAAVMLADRHLRGSLVCHDPACCPDGASSMIDSWRQHALRARARQIEEVSAMPGIAWRLNHIAGLAARAATVARTANEVLEHAGLRDRVPERSFRSLAVVAEDLRRALAGRAQTA